MYVIWSVESSVDDEKFCLFIVNAFVVSTCRIFPVSEFGLRPKFRNVLCKIRVDRSLSFFEKNMYTGLRPKSLLRIIVLFFKSSLRERRERWAVKRCRWQTQAVFYSTRLHIRYDTSDFTCTMYTAAKLARQERRSSAMCHLQILTATACKLSSRFLWCQMFYVARSRQSAAVKSLRVLIAKSSPVLVI